MSRLLIHNLSFIAINCIKLRLWIATVQLEKITLKTHMYIAKISSGRYNEYGFMAAKTDSWTDLRKE